MELISPLNELASRAQQLRAFVFDWDGVFNGGFKDLDGGSPFSEVGSMGVNMLRFSAYLNHGELPFAAVISGKENSYAKKFAQREHLHGLYMGYSDKRSAFAHFLETNGLRAEEVAFIFDDILDLNLASQAGLRIMMGGDQTDILQETVIARGEVDAITTLSGQQNGLRQACEFLIECTGNFKEVVNKRVEFEGDYSTYLTARNAVELVERVQG